MNSSICRHSILVVLTMLCLACSGSCPVMADVQKGQQGLQLIILGKHEYPATIDLMTGDTMAVISLQDIYCFTQKHFRNKKHEENFWRMVRDVKKTLPIAKDARKLMTQAYIDMQDMTEKEQDAHFKKLEKDLFDQYKPRLKRLNYRQGKLLVRLVDRECEKQTYAIIREFLGKRRAFFWNMFGKMFGVSLKAEWDPDGKDRELEDVCIQVEQGLI